MASNLLNVSNLRIKDEIIYKECELVRRYWGLEDFIKSIPTVVGKELAKSQIAAYHPSFCDLTLGQDICCCQYSLINVGTDCFVSDLCVGDTVLCKPYFKFVARRGPPVLDFPGLELLAEDRRAPHSPTRGADISPIATPDISFDRSRGPRSPSPPDSDASLITVDETGPGEGGNTTFETTLGDRGVDVITLDSSLDKSMDTSQDIVTSTPRKVKYPFRPHPTPPTTPGGIRPEDLEMIDVPGLVLRRRSACVLPHPSHVQAPPLESIHRSTQYHRENKKSLWEVFRLEGRKVQPPANIKTYHCSLGGAPMYDHKPHCNTLGEPLFLQLQRNMGGLYTLKSLCQELTFAMVHVLTDLHIPNFLDRIDIVLSPLHIKSAQCAFDGITTIQPHQPGHYVSGVIHLMEATLTDPMTLISVFLHEMAHVLSDCFHEKPMGRESHDMCWVRTNAYLIKLMSKAPLGEGLQLIYEALQAKGLGWSESIRVYPFTIPPKYSLDYCT